MDLIWEFSWGQRNDVKEKLASEN